MSMIDSQNIEEQIKSIIAEVTEIEPEKISHDAKFVEDLGMDSMMALEILASIEKKYKIKIPEDNLMKLTNLRQTIELVNRFLNQ